MIKTEYSGTPDRKRQEELELYLHIPFCVRKCKYCDFLSAPADAQVQNAYMEALLREVRESTDGPVIPMVRESTAVPPGQREVTSIYIGGGTPSAVDPAWIVKLMDCIRECYRVAEEAEITLEVNPGTVTRQSLAMYRGAGINRLSIGCQSTDDGELARIGRIHTFTQFLDTYQWARESGFTNVNVDLMNALPGQGMADVERNLERILGLDPRPEHLSVYSLIVEEGTPFYQMEQTGVFAAGEMRLPDEELEREMYWRTAELLKAQGYEHYEISNFARPGYQSRHNCGYWERRDYLGFGLGAASLYENMRFSNTRILQDYIRYWGVGGQVRSAEVRENDGEQGTGEQDTGRQGIREQVEVLRPREQTEEAMFLGLRMAGGVRVNEFRRRYGCEPEEIYRAQIAESIQEGLLEKKEDTGKEADIRYVLTKRGVDVSNYVMAKFIGD